MSDQPPSPPNGTARKLAVRTFAAAVIAHVLADFFGQSVWPVYKKLAGLDLAVAGLVATVVSMIGTATQPFFGLWADRRGRRPFILLGTALTALALLLGPLTPLWPAIDRNLPSLFGLPGSYAVMLLILMAGRLGQDMFHPAGAGLAGSLSQSGRHGSTFVAVFIAFGSMGYGLSQVGFSLTYRHFAGHTELLLIPGVIMWLMVSRWCRPPAIAASGGTESLAQAFRALRPVAGRVLVLFLILSLNAAVNGGLFFLMPEFATQCGYPAWLGEGGAFGFIILGSTLMMVPMGHLSDRFGRRGTLMVMMVLSTVAYHSLVRLPMRTGGLPVGQFIALCIVAGAFLGTVNPLGVALGQRLAPRNVSMVSAIMMGMSWCLGNVSPSIVGEVAKRTDPAYALAWLGVGNVAMIAIGLFLPRSKAAAGAN